MLGKTYFTNVFLLFIKLTTSNFIIRLEYVYFIVKYFTFNKFLHHALGWCSLVALGYTYLDMAVLVDLKWEFWKHSCKQTGF